MVPLAALLILALWVTIALCLLGIGQALMRFLRVETHLVDSFWAGLAVSVAFLETWHLLLPVTPAAMVVLIIPAAGWLSARNSIAAQFRHVLGIGRGPLVLYALIVALLALRSAGPCSYYDTGLYGAAAVRWSQAYPAVPGLANLHGRLGFDSAVMLCIAAMGPGRWPDLGYHLFPGLIVAAMWASVLPALCKARRKSRATPVEWFLVFLTIPVTHWTLSGWIVGTITDLPASAAAFLAVAFMIERLSDTSPRNSSSDARVVAIASLCALAVVFKLSTAAIASATWAAGLLWILNNRDAPISHRRARLWFVYVAIPAIVVIPWVFSNIITSGFPFYPGTILPLHADWIVPAAQAHWDSDMIRSWARIPAVPIEKTAGWSWVGPWFLRNLGAWVYFTCPLVMSVAAIMCLWAFRIRHIGRRSDAQTWLWMLVPAVAGLAFWFWTAPDPRFGEAAIWTTTAILGARVLSIIDDTWRNGISRCVILGIVIVALCGLGPPVHLFRDQYKVIFTSDPLAPLRRSPVSQRYTRSGLLVYMPLEPSKDDRTWGAPLPNTPYFNPDLALRNPADMRWGFTVAAPHLPTAAQVPEHQALLQSPATGGNAAAPPTSRISP